MKVLVFAHELHVGGTQVNAIDLSSALRDVHGYEVVLFGKPGAMVKLIEERQLRYLPAPWPFLERMRALREVVRRECPDVIHIWDWPQCLDAYYSVYLPMQVPMVVTDMNMALQRLLPKALPTTYGTPYLLDQAKAAGRRSVQLLLPPVDVHRNSPDAVDPTAFRQKYGIADGDFTLVTVSRLVDWMKEESLRRTIEVVRTLGREMPLRFVIVGDGTSRSQLEKMAEQTNAELGRAAVVLTGALLDPRPAYAAADIVVGMGGSALRGMAFGKPVLIVGERGFSAPFTPETADFFYYNGIYGLGDGESGSTRLAGDIKKLLERPGEFRALGEFSRQFVVKHFALEEVSAKLAEICRATAARAPRFGVAAADGLRTAAVLVGGKLLPQGVRRRLIKLTGNA